MRRVIFCVFILLLPLFGFAKGEEMELSHPFKTDFCTGWLDGTFEYDWSECCLKHDLAFWAGGTLEDRNAMDKNLRQCVRDKANDFYATIIYFGVRAGRYSPVKLESKKWGNAWGKEFTKRELTTREIQQLENSLRYHPDLPLSEREIDQFILRLEQRNSL